MRKSALKAQMRSKYIAYDYDELMSVPGLLGKKAHSDIDGHPA